MRRPVIRRPAPPKAFVFALLIAAALAVSAMPAQAQLGRLKKIGADIAKEATREAAGLPPKESSKGKENSDYAVNAERIDVVLGALAPFVEEARKEAAAAEAKKSFEGKRAAWEQCATDATKRMTTMSVANLEKMAPFTEKSSEMLTRMSDAMQAGQKRNVAFLQDSIGVLSIQSTIAMSGAKCGAPVYTPAAMIDAQVARDANNTGEVGEDGRRLGHVQVPEASRKDLSTRQFGIIRERLAIYAIEMIKPNGSTASLKSFTDAERTALDARAADLKSIAPYFRDGFIRWTTWGDVKAW